MQLCVEYVSELCCEQGTVGVRSTMCHKRKEATLLERHRERAPEWQASASCVWLMIGTISSSTSIVAIWLSAARRSNSMHCACQPIGKNSCKRCIHASCARHCIRCKYRDAPAEHCQYADIALYPQAIGSSLNNRRGSSNSAGSDTMR